MTLQAIIKNSADEDIPNEIPPHVYHFISETLLQRIDGLNKYKTWSFDRFFASCIHNLLLEVSENLSSHNSASDRPLVAALRQEIIDMQMGVANKPSALMKFIAMIEAHPAPHKGLNYRIVTDQLVHFIKEHALVPECIAIISQYQIPGITHFSIIQTTLSQEKKQSTYQNKTCSLFKKRRHSETPSKKESPITLNTLFSIYKIPEGDLPKLLRAIAQRGHIKHLESLAGLTSINAIINTQSPSGRTALHWLVQGAQVIMKKEGNEKYQHQYQTSYQWLIQQGADDTVLDEKGKTALAYDDIHWFTDTAPAEANTL